MPWVLAYRLNNLFSFTVAEDPLKSAFGTRLAVTFEFDPSRRPQNLCLVFARYFPDLSDAETELEKIESTTTEESIALIERENPDWGDYITHHPHRLYPPGEDPGPGALARHPRGPRPPLQSGHYQPRPPQEDN